MKNFFNTIIKWAIRNKDPFIVGFILLLLALYFNSLIQFAEWVGGTIINILYNWGIGISDSLFVDTLKQDSVKFYIDTLVILILTGFGFIYLEIKDSFLRVYVLVEKSIHNEVDETNIKKIVEAKIFGSDYTHLIIFIVILVFVILASVGLYTQSLRDNFKNSVAQLSIYLPDKTIKELDYEWINIKNKGDYDSLNVKVQKYLSQLDTIKEVEKK